ncbi:Crp/Fnr family transcriptional regulator [Actinomadura sp. 9N407]|uniref:Crp/Fnr family transcriptional regulator n=1 Tax=Actinomadura sp. 9N407 TaxID=3375154 RepID=UPI00378873DF
MTALEPGSFFAELTSPERADLERHGRFRELGQGDVLFREGELTTSVAILLSGRVKAYSNREHGGEALLDVRGPGALLGEVAAIDGRPRSATVATLEPARVLTLTEEAFMAFLSRHGRVSVIIMKMLCQRWRDADRKRAEFGMFDATGRVAQRLVELAERFGEPYEPYEPTGRAKPLARPGRSPRPGVPGAQAPPGPPRPPGAPGLPGRARSAGIDGEATGASVQINLHLSQEELASWVGASREAVSKALGTLRRHGWIETGRRRVIVHDLQALRRHAR